MNKTIAYLCSSVSWGGLEMNHLRNAAWMHSRGHKILILGVADSPYLNRAEEMGLPFKFIQTFKKYYDFKAAKNIQRVLEKEHISHLLIRDTRDMSMAAILKRKMGDALTTAYFMEMQLGVKKKGIGHTIRFKYIDIWSCPLTWLKYQVEEMTNFKNTLVEIPSGVELENFSLSPSKSEARSILNIPENDIVFGLIGRFDPQKGQTLLIQAMEKAKNKNFKVLLLGEPTKGEEGPYLDELNQFIQEHSDRVLVRPFRKDITTFYAAIDWLVMATKAETVGMVTIEALATGKPVLGSNAGGTPDIIQQDQGGVLFESMDADDLAQKIDFIIDNKVSFDVEKLKKLVQKFDHNSVCESVEKVLKLNRPT